MGGGLGGKNMGEGLFVVRKEYGGMHLFLSLFYYYFS